MLIIGERASAVADREGRADRCSASPEIAPDTADCCGNPAEVLSAIRRALDIAVRIGDADLRLRSLRLIFSYEKFVGEHDAAMRTIEDFASFAAAANPSALPDGETHRGMANLHVGRLQASRQRLERLYENDLRNFDDPRFARSNALATAACPVFFLTGRHRAAGYYAAMLDDQVMRHGIVIWRPTALFYHAAL
jgi:hypothetical protein